MARGGKNYPANPAAVSGPGALSARTDGGPGSASQPIRTIPGQGYGATQAQEAQQAGAPMAAGEPSGTGARPAPAAVSPPPVPGPMGGVFGPTQRPGESPLAGMSPRSSAIAADVDGFLRILYSQFQHPGIAMLLRKDM